MTYNEKMKDCTYKWRKTHAEEFHKQAIACYHKYREKNLEMIQEKDRLRKRPFEMEWRSFRKIDLFN
jgi:hypothetical protein